MTTVMRSTMPDPTLFNQILIPTDGESADSAIETGLDIAMDHDAAVHALYVVDTTSSMSHFDLVVERREAAGERAVETVERRANERGIEVTKAFRYGVPHEAILDYATDYEIDLIVMGTHGRSGFQRLLQAGSVAERVIRDARIPVLVVGAANCQMGQTTPVVS